MYNRTYHSTYGSSPDIKAKDNKVVRRCDHNPFYPCWNYCTCGTSGVWEVQVIGTSYDDFAQLSIDGKIGKCNKMYIRIICNNYVVMCMVILIHFNIILMCSSWNMYCG